jgi:hypothetical protein
LFDENKELLKDEKGITELMRLMIFAKLFVK